MDDLRNALAKALGTTPAPAPAAAAATPGGDAALPDPLKSDWIALLRQLGGDVPANATMGQLTQRSDLRARQLADAGRKREAAELRKAREDFERDREKRAWSFVKERFEALGLSEKTYRSLKQEGADPVKLLGRLTSRRAEELRGMGAARLREELLPAKG
jgi:hypothetical protein